MSMLFSGKFKASAIIWVRRAIEAIRATNAHQCLVTFSRQNGFTITSRDGDFATVAFQIGPVAFVEFHCDEFVEDCWLETEHLWQAMETRSEEEDVTLRAVSTYSERGRGRITGVQLLFKRRQPEPEEKGRSIQLDTEKCKFVADKIDPTVNQGYFRPGLFQVAFAIRADVFARTISDLAAGGTEDEQRTHFVRLHQLGVRVTILGQECHLVVSDDDRELNFGMNLHFTDSFQLATSFMGDRRKRVWVHKASTINGPTHVTCELPFLIVRYMFTEV